MANKNATAAKKTLENILGEVKDLGLQLAGVNQNVNTVGQVAAANTNGSQSAGSVKSLLSFGGDGGPSPVLLIGLGVVAYLVFKSK